MKIYTKTGDGGETSLFNGKRVSKGHGLVEAYGRLDELNVLIGDLRSSCRLSLSKTDTDALKAQEFLESMQNQIFCLGSYLASSFEKPEYIKDASDWVLKMESFMDEMDKELPDLKNFILPGGSETSCKAHMCRVSSRATERYVVGLSNEGGGALSEVVLYLNRVSDFFFVLSRWVNVKLSVEETLWRA